MNKMRKLLLGTGAVLLSLALFLTGRTISKYVNEREQDAPIKAAAFYFESNYLTEDNHEYKLNYDTQSIEIELYNFENALRISQVDCKYTVSVETMDESFSLTENEYTAEALATGVTKRVVLDGLKAGFQYKVTVKAQGGYEKTLSATFTVANAPDGVYMNIENTDHFVLLTVWTENVKGTASIRVPAGLIPDATDPTLHGVKNYTNDKYTEFSFTDATSFVSEFASHSYRFFKTADYQSGEFAVEVNGIIAENGSLK